MAQAELRSLEEIRRDAERARAGLTETVQQLRTSVDKTAGDIRERIAPEAIKSEVSGYLKSRGEAMLDSITEAVRANPLQAVAIGASVAVPALRVIRAIPVPILLVGAGLYLAGTKKGQAVARQANDITRDLASEAGRRARELGSELSEAASATRDYAADRLDAVSGAVASGASQLRDTADDLQHRAAGVGASISASVHDLRQQAGDAAERLSAQGAAVSAEARRTAQQTAATIGDGVAATASRVRETAEQVAEAGLASAGRARERTVEFGHRASESIEQAGRNLAQTAARNPLLVAGLGVVIGGLIASSLPRSRIEQQWVGPAARDVAEGARDLFERTKDAGVQAFEQATEPQRSQPHDQHGRADQQRAATTETPPFNKQG
ncbi:hypothetical protein BJ122_10910 [Rhodopseudomonas faecalis]|uniref:Uncharacterized protein n=1 Tax=Rhodopseudomonas faecalis TaxID=99655 RepID=A0A318TGG7_9BRAD|nr:hypothetical protein [Rhodopseudomonas faecalis]PYF02880.1 hypothetical protein BJ122_10910 [Rhodopseudomonas faecalis]